MRLAVMALGWRVGCFVSPVMHFGSGKSPEEAQHQRLSELMPPQLGSETPWIGEVHVAKIRVWADDDYRAHNVHSDHSAAFSEHSRELMLATLAGRLGRPAEHAPAPPAAEVRHPTLVVTVTDAGKTLVGGKLIDDATLGELLHLSFEDNQATEVLVKAGRGAPRGVVIKVVESARAAGLHRTSIDATIDP